MKRVLRSCLDPLPRFLSTRGVLVVVVLVVAGTAVSVHEYVESDHGADPGWPSAPQVQAVGPAERATPRGRAAFDWQVDSPRTATPAAPRRMSEGSLDSRPAPATFFDPESSSSGS